MKGRARTDVTEIRADIVSAIKRIKPLLNLQDPQVESDWAQIETFTAISLAVLAKTNPSKIKSEAMTVEIRARMDGKECLE
jgi:hypothetical protein